jgi:hypothetical protein
MSKKTDIAKALLKQLKAEREEWELVQAHLRDTWAGDGLDISHLKVSYADWWIIHEMVMEASLLTWHRG